jgi:hypothetical protein
MKLFLLVLVCLCSSGCLVSTLSPKQQVMQDGCTFPTRKGSTDLTYLCEAPKK